MRLINILAAIIVVSVLSVKATQIFTNDARNNPPTQLDVMRQRFFSIEDSLWQTINSGIELSLVLQQIHSGYRHFLRDSFSDRNSYFSTFDPDQSVLFESIKKINQSVAITVDNYLHSSRIRFRETDSLAISARNLNLTDQLDKIYEITGTTDFYSTIRNVSVTLFLLFLLLSLTEFLNSVVIITICNFFLSFFFPIYSYFIFVHRIQFTCKHFFR